MYIHGKDRKALKNSSLPTLSDNKDFKKAFDSVWHDGLWSVLHKYGINYKIVNI